MKKYILLLTLTTLLFSCTDDVIDTSSGANTDPTEDLVLVKRVVNTYLDGDIYIGNYNYEDNRILNITDENNEILVTYIYENDLLTRVNYLYAEAYTTLSYNSANNSIDITEVYYINSPPQNYKVIYNLDNTITVENYFNNTLTGEDLITFDSNENIITVTDEINEYVNNFTYDTKNNAYKNISHIEIFQLLTATTEYGFDYINGTSNNMTSWTETYQGVDDIETWEYTYNSEDYPTSATYFSDGIEEFTTEYFYE